MSRSRFLAGLAVIASLACARTQKTQAKQTAAVNSKKAAVAANEDKMQGKVVCSYENPVGSHIPERVCYYQDDLDANRQETQDFIRQHQANQLQHN